jgi:hypothetical protein
LEINNPHRAGHLVKLPEGDKMDFGLTHVTNVHEGDSWEIAEIEKRTDWTVRVNNDSRDYYYDVDSDQKEEFEEWVDHVFWKDTDNYDPELEPNYYIDWR